MTQSEQYDWSTSSIFRFGGYSLLVLALIDFINIFIPWRFTNPVWEFQMLGALVDHAPVPLIGLIFVFNGNRKYRHQVEIYLLKFLSWVTLVVGVLFLLLLPLGVNNTWRIDAQNRMQIIHQSSEQLSQVQQIKEILGQATTDQDIKNIFHSLNSQVSLPVVKNPQEVKNKLLSQMTQVEQNLQNQTKATQNDSHKELMRNSLKWNLGALVCGVVFIWIWHATDWAR